MIKIKTLYLARHGETTWNLERRTQGSKNSKLTSLGLKQAERLGYRLRDVEIDEIYCSPLERAQSTAKIVANMKNTDCILDDRLVEMNFGEWEGLTSIEIEKNYPDDYRIWRERPHIAKIPSGETIEIAQKRMVDFVNDRVIDSDKDTFLIISHGTTIRLLLLHLLSMDLKHYYKLKQNNCALNIVEIKHHGPVLVKYNDTCHMDIIIER